MVCSMRRVHLEGRTAQYAVQRSRQQQCWCDCKAITDRLHPHHLYHANVHTAHVMVWYGLADHGRSLYAFTSTHGWKWKKIGTTDHESILNLKHPMKWGSPSLIFTYLFLYPNDLYIPASSRTINMPMSRSQGEYILPVKIHSPFQVTRVVEKTMFSMFS